MVTTYQMVGMDAVTGEQDVWTATGAPDMAGRFYAGRLNKPLRNVYVASSFGSGPMTAGPALVMRRNIPCAPMFDLSVFSSPHTAGAFSIRLQGPGSDGPGAIVATYDERGFQFFDDIARRGGAQKKLGDSDAEAFRVACLTAFAHPDIASHPFWAEFLGEVRKACAVFEVLET